MACSMVFLSTSARVSIVELESAVVIKDELKSTLNEEAKTIKDKATQIKITEVAKYLVELDKTAKVNNDNLVDLLQYYELVKEIKIANGVQV